MCAVGVRCRPPLGVPVAAAGSGGGGVSMPLLTSLQMSTLNPKFLISIYDAKLQFNEDPYENNRKFAIYTPKDDEYMQNLLEKHAATVRLEKAKAVEKEEELARRRAKRHNALFGIDSPVAGAYHLKPSFNNDSDGFQLTESQDLSPSMMNEASKVKSKLQKELQLAKSFDQATEKKEIKFLKQATQKEETSLNMTDGFQMKSPTQSKSPNSWNRSIKVRTGGKTVFGKTEESPLRKTLYFDPRINSLPKKAIINPVFEGLIEKEDMVMTNPELLSSVMKLKEMKLLNIKSPGYNKYKGIGKIDYVYNDFHSRHTNPGYSRNTAGAFFCR